MPTSAAPARRAPRRFAAAVAMTATEPNPLSASRVSVAGGRALPPAPRAAITGVAG